MTCAKTRAHAILVIDGWMCFHGENSCQSPQRRCPRHEGEDYEKCKTICGQESHAEVEAINQALAAKVRIRGAELYLFGHVGPCPDCAAYAQKHGVMIYPVTPDAQKNRPAFAGPALGDYSNEL